MSNIISYFSSDWKGAMFLAIFNVARLCIRYFSSFCMNMKLKMMGVSCGRKVRWGGMAQIERFPMSEIYIGDGCTFNSKSLFNQRGIKKCIIQTGKSGAKIKIGNKCAFFWREHSGRYRNRNAR